jgi:uncharacterized delta-60 repeat protein
VRRLLLVLALSRLAYGAPGELDHSFGQDGVVETAVGGGSAASAASAVVVLPDGRILLAGETTRAGLSRAILVRYLPDGSLDDGFGDRGQVAVGLAGFTSGIEGNLIVDGAGRILLTTDGGLARFVPTGEVDGSFGVLGIFDPHELGEPPFTAAMSALRPDGRIVVGGNAFGPFHPGDNGTLITLLQLLPNGTVDPGFGNAGRVLAPEVLFVQSTTALAIQPDGRVVAAGTGFDQNEELHSMLVRFDSSGAVDSTFADQGVAETNIDGNNLLVQALLMLPDGRLVTAGEISSSNEPHELALARYLADGKVDVTFGHDGLAIIPTGALGGVATSLARQDDGNLLVAGWKTLSPNTAQMVLARVAPDGSLDATFGSGGLATAGSMDAATFTSAIAVQPDGKPVLAGYTTSSSTFPEVTLARFVIGSEVCGNCVDDDGDGLIDLEDSECCSSDGSLALERLAVRPRHRGSEFTLDARTDITPAAPSSDVLLQTRQNGTVRCGVIDADRLATCHKDICARARGIRAESGGLHRLRLSAEESGQRVVASGRGGLFDMHQAGEIELRMGFREGHGGQARCDLTQTTLHWTPHGSLRAP